MAEKMVPRPIVRGPGGHIVLGHMEDPMAAQIQSHDLVPAGTDPFADLARDYAAARGLGIEILMTVGGGESLLRHLPDRARDRLSIIVYKTLATSLGAALHAPSAHQPGTRHPRAHRCGERSGRRGRRGAGCPRGAHAHPADRPE